MFTERLVEAGLTLIAEAQGFATNDLVRARGVRNGLIIALLAFCPVRLTNYAMLEIGQTFKQVYGRWWIASGRARDKARVDLYGHDIRVTAFPVRHGLRHAFGFRFETPDKIVVMSGDTAPTPSLVEHCAGCDVLIHETYSQATYEKVSRKWQRYRRTHHTSSRELAALAERVKPDLLVLYHRANAGGALTLADPEESLLSEIRQLYRGRVVAARDLDVF